MLSKTMIGKVVRVAGIVNVNAGKAVLIRFSSTDTGKKEAPMLPGLSMDQIRKIGETDTSLRTRHIQIEGEMSDEERDIARVSFEIIISPISYQKYNCNSFLTPPMSY